MICNTPGCMNETSRQYRFCPNCILKLLENGLCKGCGKNPRKPKHPSGPRQSHYCEACQKIAADIAEHRRDNPPRGNLPCTEGAKEITEETKRGVTEGIYPDQDD